jgi:hypothetical protein
MGKGNEELRSKLDILRYSPRKKLREQFRIKDKKSPNGDLNVEYNQTEGDKDMNRNYPTKVNSPTPVQEEKDRPTWTVLLVIAVCLVIIAMLTGCKSDSAQPTQAPPVAPAEPSTIDAANLLETRCSVCHSPDRAKQATKTHDEWDQTVTRMIGKGAQLTEEENTVLVDYLTKTYGP